MHSLYVERRTLNDKDSIAWDIAHHLYARLLCGKVAVVADNPASTLSAVRKQWMQILRQIGNLRSSTLEPSRIDELSEQLERARSLKFSMKPPKDQLEADVTFATVESFLRVPPTCCTVYVTYDFAKVQLHMLTSWMPKRGVVVIYEQE